MTVGAVFVVLCCASFVLAIGFRPAFLDAAGLDALKAEWLYVSSFCYAACGFALLWSKQR